MALEIRVPRLGWTMEQGTFGGWLKKDGEAVKEGMPLFTVEGDKALQEVEAFGDGVLRIAPECPASGATVDVGALLGYLVSPEEAGSFPARPSAAEGAPAAAVVEPFPCPTPSLGPTSSLAPASRVSAAAAPKTALAPAGGVGPAVAPPTISPRALRLAQQLGIDWTRLKSSSRSGRIVERDIIAERDALAAALPARKSIPLSPLRKIIAERMHEGSSVTAPVTLAVEADATELVASRERLKAAAADGSAPTFTDLFIVLVSRTLALHPLLNARFEGGEIVLEDAVHMAIAVDAPDGLLVPVLRDAGRKTLRDVARESKVLIEKARARKLAPEEMQGGTFTLTNLGLQAVDAFTPILNPPQCAILGIGRIVRKPAVCGDAVVPRHRVTLSLTFDHRVVDGAPAARFLSAVVEQVESPSAGLQV